MTARMRRSSGCKGSALIETALCFTVLFTTLLGISELAIVAYSYHSLSEVARQTSRWAAVRGSVSCGPKGSAAVVNCDATASNIQTFAVGLGYVSALTSSNVSVAWCNPPTNGVADTKCTTTNSPGNLVKVTVSYQVPLVLPMISSNLITMSSTSKMLITQ